MQLVIGNKNYSSWSMRPWVLMRAAGIAFDERKLRFGNGFETDGEFKRQVATLSPAGRVPVLVTDTGLAIWDTLAIAETLAEMHPQLALWPVDAAARARARSICAEMHSGFTTLRNHCPMNIEAALPEVGARLLATEPGVVADLQRIGSMWEQQLEQHGGPWLFGARFCIADAMYAPVCSRLKTYALPLPPAAAAYAGRVLAHPAVAEWIAGALAEHDFVAVDEPYRSAPLPA
ncbi:glutathione S-transferase [Rivibacter subsaxonicus]|uniref:Glutathione S-transferase n=1 Tax=Rivibacter subsaxonicus TaxID=457575 RepID=A0A4Q7VZ95_9BURK|nr:glutathione S-transferase [Rivibacter subsaxonicus]RZU02174.1 glutathione S-transferase [Rivibacter subsaxonicus]